MDETIVAELSALRARAYGPDADLSGDPVALGRLQELEQLALYSRAAEREPVLSATEGGVGPGAALAEPVLASAAPRALEPGFASAIAELEDGRDHARVEERGDPEAEEAANPRFRWTRGRVVALWIGSLVVAVLIAAAAASALTYRLQADPREVGVLSADPEADWPPFFGDQTENSAIFAPFHGLRPVVTGTFAGPSGGTCLAVVDGGTLDPDAERFRGPVAYGCGAGVFPATVQLVVTSEFSDELRERFPDGTSLQFVLEDDRVRVLSVPPSAEPLSDDVTGAER